MNGQDHSHIHGYKVLRFLGRGKSAYSYLIEYEGALAVLKDIHHEPVPQYSFSDKLAHEVEGYERLVPTGLAIPKLLVVNQEKGYLVKEYVAGPTLLDEIANGDIHVDCYRAHVLLFASLECQGINLDYFPANFVRRAQTLVYIDYEANDYQDRWNFENWGVPMWFHVDGCRFYQVHQDASRLVTVQGDAIIVPAAEPFLQEIRRLDAKDLLTRFPDRGLAHTRMEAMQDGLAATTYRLKGPKETTVLKLYSNTYPVAWFQSEVSSFQTYPDLHPRLHHVLDHRPNRTMGLWMEHIDTVIPTKNWNNDEDIDWLIGPYTTLLHRLHQSATAGSARTYLKQELSRMEPHLHQVPLLPLSWKWLSQRIDTIEARAAVPIHGDYHPWNLLVDASGHAWMIDRKDRWSDARYDVFWSVMLMRRSGFNQFANRFLDAYQQLDPTILEDQVFFEVYTSVAWLISVLPNRSESTYLETLIERACIDIEVRLS
jgi:hypothetical protein